MMLAAVFCKEVMAMADSVIRMEGLTKRFPGVLAVDNASLSIDRGTVHAIVGGNGAGKSTLIKMLSGFYPYGDYEGEFFLEGERCEFKNVLDAEAKGIAMVPQDLNMVNDMSVADNLFIAKQPIRNGFIDDFRLLSESQRIIDDFGLNVSPKTRVKDIGIAQKQLIVIARAMHNNVKAIILDEPTATLSNDESELLFRKVREMRDNGIAVIYISHRLEEVAALSDKITVMRDGCIIETDDAGNMDDHRIVSLMVGKDIDDYYPAKTHKPGNVLMSVRNISVYSKKNPEQKIVDDVSFDLKAGEILAVYGLVGSGRTEMVQGLTGSWEGNVEYSCSIEGKEIVNRNSASSLDNGIALLPEDRKREGVIGIQTISTNISASSMSRFSRFGFIKSFEERKNSAERMKELSVKANNMDVLVNTLSGGNQQKVILSRLITTHKKIFILDEATQGIDVEAKSQIYSILDKLASEGIAILFISSDIAEVMGIADRIMVIRQGKLVSILENTPDLDKERVLWLATVGGEK